MCTPWRSHPYPLLTDIFSHDADIAPPPACLCAALTQPSERHLIADTTHSLFLGLQKSQSRVWTNLRSMCGP